MAAAPGWQGGLGQRRPCSAALRRQWGGSRLVGNSPGDVQRESEREKKRKRGGWPLLGFCMAFFYRVWIYLRGMGLRPVMGST